MATGILAPVEQDGTATRRLLFLWFGVLAAPTAFLLNLEAKYVLVVLACDRSVVWVHLVALLSLAAAVAGGVAAWRERRLAGAEEPGEGFGPVPRSRFMAALGLLMSGLFALIILAQWIPLFVQEPCSVL